MIKIQNFRQKKYVAVEDPKLHKTGPVNFFLQCVKKIKNQKFWNRKQNNIKFQSSILIFNFDFRFRILISICALRFE